MSGSLPGMICLLLGLQVLLAWAAACETLVDTRHLTAENCEGGAMQLRPITWNLKAAVISLLRTLGTLGFPTAGRPQAIP